MKTKVWFAMLAAFVGLASLTPLAALAADDGGVQDPIASMYAEREADAPELELFAGGDDPVYVGAGAVLLVVLLLVLI